MDRNEISDDNIVKISPFYGSFELSINILTTVLIVSFSNIDLFRICCDYKGDKRKSSQGN